MERYQVEELFSRQLSKKQLTVEVPGSKSITNRALLLAALAEGESVLEGVLFSDDSRHFLDCVEKLGMETWVDEEQRCVRVSGHGGRIPVTDPEVDVGSAGTAARFLAAFLGLSQGSCRMDASAQMRRRPMVPLLKTLQEMGASFSFWEKEGHFPFTVTGAGLLGTPVMNCENSESGDQRDRLEVSVNIDNSSQFLSALLIALGAYRRESLIGVEGTHGMAYIDMTVRMMEQFGVKAVKEGAVYRIGPQQGYQPRHYRIEPDASAACYFYAMAPLLGISVTVPGIHENSLQGDVEFVHILERMGCSCQDTPEGICVTGPEDGSFDGITADMHSCSDQAITLAAIAPFAKSPTLITGIGHIRLQESDRIAAICTELTRMGICCEELPDGVKIWPGHPCPAELQTYEDHRMAMGFSLTGLRAQGIVINDPLCCRKTFENYFEVLEEVIKGLR